MEETIETSIDLRGYLALAWHWAWLLILAAVLAAGGAYVFSARMTPVYQASTLVLVSQAPSEGVNEYSAVMMSERLARTYAQIMTTQPVLDGVIERMGLPLSAGDLKGAITVSPVRDTTLIQVSVEDTDRARAAGIANALVAEFAEQNRAEQATRFAASKQSFESQLAQLDGQIQGANRKLAGLGSSPEDQMNRDRLEVALAQYRQTYAGLLASYEEVRLAEAQTTSSVIQKEPAVPPSAPVRPRVLQNTALAAVVGLMLAVGGVFLIDLLDDTVKSPEDFSARFGLPLLGLIVAHPHKRGKKNEAYAIAVHEPRAPISEAFRALRTNIQFAGVDKPIRTLLITSPSPQDGKSTVTANLATVMAQSGRRVTLIDADLRRPRIHRVMEVNNRSGLSDLFVSPRPHLNGNLQATQTQNLAVLSSGPLPPNPSELLGSNKMLDVIELIAGQSDMVLIDTPPLLAVTDAAVLAPRVDAVLLVVRPGVTRMAAVSQAVEQLRRVNANLVGVVFNAVDLKRSRYAYYYRKDYYYTYHAYGAEKVKEPTR